MAQSSGKMKSTSRQGAGGTQTLSFTVETSAGPPPVEETFVCDADFFADAKDYLGKQVVVTYTVNPAGPPNTCSGLKGSAP